jgi:serine/threonine protein kinase
MKSEEMFSFYFSRKVIKEFDLRGVPIEGQKEEYFPEAFEMSKFKHENIIKYFEHFKQGEYFYIVFEYCEVSFIIKSNIYLIYK